MSNKERNIVSRKKYEKLKYTLEQWCDKTYNLKDKLVEKDIIIDELKQQIKILKETAKQYHDTETFEELENETKNQHRMIRSMKKKINSLEIENKKINTQYERNMILKDSKIQQLEEIRRDLKERNKELRDDIRWERQNKKGEK